MSRTRSPDRNKAFEIYKKNNGKIDLVEIAKQLNISDGTVRGWKNKDKWEDKLNGTLQKNTERSNKKVKEIKKPIAEDGEEVLYNTGLNDKQRLFCIYYIKCFNATKAYQKAYGCSYQVALVNGSRLLGNAKVKEEITKLKVDKLKGAMLEPGDVLQKYIDIAFSDISDYLTFGQKELPLLNPLTGEEIVNEDGETVTYTVNYVDFKESNEIDGTVISEVSKGKDGVKIKLQDKMKALDWLANHMDLLDTSTKEKLDIEKQKVQISREKLELDKQQANKDSKLDQPIEIIIKRKGEGNADS